MGYKRMDVMNRRGHVRRAVFERLEAEHLSLWWEREIFFHVMSRDYSVPCYYMESPHVGYKGWAKGYNMSSARTRWDWDELEKMDLVKVKSFSATYRMYGTEQTSPGRVDFTLEEKGQLFVVKKTLELNALLWKTAHPGQPFDDDDEVLGVIEDEIRDINGVRRMDRYIRC